MAYDGTKPVASSTLTSSEIRENFRALKEDGIVAVASKGVVQEVTYQTQAHFTGTTNIPLDFSYPQNTEGTEIMTLAITPTNSSNTLIIDATLFGIHFYSVGEWIVIALFQDSTANALCATAKIGNGGGAYQETPLRLRYIMTAGTTSATTFKVRVGTHASGVGWYVNRWLASEDIFGGAVASTITITEVKA